MSPATGLLAVAACGMSAQAVAQEPETPTVVVAQTAITPVIQPSASDAKIDFAFERTPWRDVIRWLADTSDLALHYEDLPTGSFTYSDSQTYTPRSAMDRINLFLLPQGYTLVQTGKLLSVINLADPRSQMQLDTLAELITPDQLDQRENQEVVKCMFPLGALQADDAVEELVVLNLMQTPAVLSKTNQLLVTDTVAKLKSVRSVIQAFVPRTLANGTTMKSFALKHVTAEDILSVARPHLGLASDEMIGIDVSLSADFKGEHIFATGVEDKIALIEQLVASLDKPIESLTAEGSSAELKSHLVRGGNVKTVHDVLQTLLAGKTLRLSIDEAASSIVALASPDVQREIAATVAQLEADEADFEVIPLRNVEPVFAISLLDEMLDLSGADAPNIDADPGNKRLFVRGKRHDIDQIKRIVAGLDVPTHATNERMRVLPVRGRSALEQLETAAKFWSLGNPILLLQTDESESDSKERVVTEPERKSQLVAVTRGADAAERFLTSDFDPQAAPIRCQLTANGLLVQSDDLKALDAFEKHLLAIVGPTDTVASAPVVFYLKYTKAAEAITMLAELLDGGEAAREGAAGTLVNGYVSSYSGFLGSFVTARDGTITMSSGSITVVADPRLNRLITQGTTSDIARIDEYLAIIDKDESLTAIQVYGTSHVVELMHTRASEVAKVIREAYADRMASAGKSPAGAAAKPAAGKAQQPAKTPGRSSPATSALAYEPKMTVTVHDPSNSLIVTAPEALFGEVERLAKMIDARNEQTMEVVSGGGGALEALLVPGARRSGRGRGRSGVSLADLLRGGAGK